MTITDLYGINIPVDNIINIKFIKYMKTYYDIEFHKIAKKILYNSEYYKEREIYFLLRKKKIKKNWNLLYAFLKDSNALEKILARIFGIIITYDSRFGNIYYIGKNYVGFSNETKEDHHFMKKLLKDFKKFGASKISKQRMCRHTHVIYPDGTLEKNYE